MRSAARPPSETPRWHTTHALGDVIAGKYSLTGVLGEGGMGSVFRARNLALDVDVAIKLIRRDADGPEAAARLLREARAAARLLHPSIVRVHDFGETEHGDPFIVMEVLRGGSLANLLDREGRLPAERAVRLLLPVAAALAAAHDRGVIHRDLKPANVMLGDDDAAPKVVDFGIAKLTTPEDPRFTQTGAVLGSPDYMSPEQARGRSDIDARTDVWSLSVVLYEAVSGRRPFEGDNPFALLGAIIEETPPPITRFAAGDAELWRIIERGLSKSPAGRWPTMRDLGRALAAWAVDRGIETDVAGTSIAAVWLGGAPRAASVHALSPTLVAGPPAPPQGCGEASVPRTPGALAVPRSASTKGSRIATVVLVAVVAVGIVGSLSFGLRRDRATAREPELPAAPGAPPAPIAVAPPPAPSAIEPASAAPGDTAIGAHKAPYEPPVDRSVRGPGKGKHRGKRSPPLPADPNF